MNEHSVTCGLLTCLFPSWDIDEVDLISWINTNLPSTAPPAADLAISLTSGLTLYRLVECIKGIPPNVPDSDFSFNGAPEKLDGLFKLFDLMLDYNVRIGSVSINDVRSGNKEKVTQLVKSLKAWQEGIQPKLDAPPTEW